MGKGGLEHAAQRRSKRQPERKPLFQLEPEVRAASAAIERNLVADYGSYPENHPVFQYVASILQSAVPAAEYPKLRLIITRGWDEFNACALPSGTIIVSDRMLEYCEDMEEIQWVLRHEWKHIQREHGAQRDHSPHRRASVKEAYNRLARNIGRNRLQEYEADLRARTDDHSALDLNPYGGIRFTERLVQDERRTKTSGGVVHGNSMDRLLNLHAVNRILDTKSLQHQLTPISEAVVRSLQKTHSFTHVVIGTEEEKNRALGAYMHNSLDAMRAASPDQVHVVIRKLFERYTAQKESYDSVRTESLDYQLSHTKSLLDIAIPKLKQDITATLRGVTSSERAVFRGLIAGLVHGVPIEDAIDPKSPAHAFVDFFEYFEASEDYDRLPAQLRALGEMDVVCLADPTPLLRRVCSEANASGMFDDELASGDVGGFCGYVEKVVDATIALYSEGEIARNRILLSIFPEALTGIARPLLPAAMQQIAERFRCPVYIISEVAAFKYGVVVPQEVIESLQGTAQEEVLGTWPHITRLAQAANPFHFEFYMPFRSDEELGIDKQREKVSIASLSVLRAELRKLPWTTPEEAIAGARDYVASIADERIQWIVASLFIRKASLILNAKTLPAVCRREDALRYMLELVDAFPMVGVSEKSDGILAFLSPKVDKPDKLDELEKEDERHAIQRFRPWLPTDTDISIRDLRAIVERLELSELDAVSLAKSQQKVHNEVMDSLYAEYYYGRLRYVLTHGSRADFFTALKDNLAYIPERQEYVDPTRLVIDVFTTYTFDFANPTELDQLLTLTTHMKDMELGNRLQERVITAMFDVYDNAALEHILFRDERTRRRLLYAVRTRYVEERLRTPEQLRAAVDDIARSRVFEDEFFQTQAGKVIMVRDLVEHMNRNPLRTIAAALDTEWSDTEMVKIVAQAALSHFMSIDPDNKIVEESEALKAPNVTNMMRRLYEMDDLTRRALIRELLVGKKGLLFDPKQVQLLVNRVFEKHIAGSADAQEQALRKGLQETMATAARIADPATLYFMLEPFLFEHMWRRPKHGANWNEVERHLTISNDKHVQWDDRVVVKTLIAAMSGEVATQDSDSVERLDNRLLEEIYRYAPPVDRAVDQQKTNAMDFIRMVASQLGAPGVRLLQVVGQYVPMSPEMARSFSTVYDGLSGQPKLSAFVTMDREWETMDEELIEMGKTIGGASLATVWETITVNGNEVVKVLNPNAEFFVDSMCSILENTFAAMEKRYPVQARLGVLAVRDIREWVKADIRDTDWMPKDREFFTTHSGFPFGEGKYRIRVPKIYGKESQYYKREEKIAGKNLTALDELRKEGHDLKEIVRVLCSHVGYQIATGRVHSDIHPGNIRITPENEVVWLDRSLYIDLAPVEQGLIMGLASGAGNPTELFAGYCASLPENSVFSEVALGRLFEETQVDLSQPHGVAQLISIAKERGVYVPLKVTILVKNFLSLNKLAQDVGFGSLRDAMVAEAA